jgi:hypothetical protein
MSDPFSPYQPPSPYPPSAGGGQAPHGYAYPGTHLPGMAPQTPGVVRAAAIMTGILGGLILVGSVLIALVFLLVPIETFEAEGALQGMPPEVDARFVLNFAAGCIGICGGVMGICFLVLCPFVWKGNRGGMITAIIVTSMAVLLMLINGVGSLFQGGGGQAVMALVMNLGIAAIFGALLFLLIRSLTALRQRDEQLFAASQQAAWYYQQQYAQQPPAPPGPGPTQQQTGWGQGGEPPQR